MERKQGASNERNKTSAEADLAKKALNEFHVSHECTVHELPVNKHRVTHDTFIDGDHAAQEDDKGIPVELPPFGVHRIQPKETPPDLAA